MKFREAFRLGVCVGFGVIGYKITITAWNHMMNKLDELTEKKEEE